MIDIKEIGESSFDYFPQDIILNETLTDDLLNKYNNHQSTIHTEKLYDNSLITEGVKVGVRSSGNVGTLTNWHNTEQGLRNGGVEVIINNKKEYYYPHQLKKLL